MNSNDRIVYEANQQEIEELIKLIRKTSLDPHSLGFPYYTRQNLEKIQSSLHTEEFMTGIAMRILEERDWRDRELG